MSNIFNCMFEKRGVAPMVRKYHARPRFWLVLALLALAVFGISFLVANHRLQADAAALAAKTAQCDQIVREIGELEKQIAFAQTDEYVERAARDDLGLLKPGEVRYVNGSGM
jgi:cell division protein FtsB